MERLDIYIYIYGEEREREKREEKYVKREMREEKREKKRKSGKSIKSKPDLRLNRVRLLNSIILYWYTYM